MATKKKAKAKKRPQKTASRSTSGWNPGGKYANVTPDRLCSQIEQLTDWIWELRRQMNIANLERLPGQPAPVGGGSPPPFP